MTPAARPPPEPVVSEVSTALPDDATAPGQARKVVREALRSWALEDLMDDAELAVSELVTNALRHGLPPVTVSLRLSRSSLRIDVSDLRPATAHLQLAVVSKDEDESGRGRGIVEQVSDRSGVESTADDGKVVYVAWDVDSQG